MFTLFDQVYRLMEQSFPPAEFRTREGQAALLDDPRYLLVPSWSEEGALAGFMAVWELPPFQFVEHIAVQPALRGRRIGEGLLTRYAQEAGDSGTIVLEVEPPEPGWPGRRVAFYERLGFVLNDYDYVQPPLRGGLAPLPLKLMSYGRALTEAEFRAFRDTVYRHVYRYVPPRD